MVEAHEIAEKIHENAEGEHHESHDTFRKITAIYVGVVAMLLAIATLGGAEATKEMLNANIHSADTYAFYQSKYIRQITYQVAAEQLELLGAASPGLPQEHVNRVNQLVTKYRDTAKRYESEPATGDGKKELLAKAAHYQEVRDHAEAKLPNFEYAEALFQIAIVLGSVSIVAASPALLGVSGLLSIGGLLLMLNGYLLIYHLPHG